jgi:hypothetical protein
MCVCMFPTLCSVTLNCIEQFKLSGKLETDKYLLQYNEEDVDELHPKKTAKPDVISGTEMLNNDDILKILQN